jgi:phage/plasmid primase-like uncharacterized protein
MIPATTIERARSVPIEVEVASRGVNLRTNHKQLTGPCPLCGGTDRFNVDPRKNLWLCRGCRVGGDVIKLVRHLDGCSFRSAVELLTGDERQQLAASAPSPAERERLAAAEERRQQMLASSLWAKRKPIEGTLASRYLFWRGVDYFPATLGYLPPHQAHPPTMIAVFGVADEPEPGVLAAPTNVTGIHLTRLTPEGRKVATGAKIMLGPSAGQPIVLAPVNDLLGLAITEGIEDALAVHAATGLGVWAAGSATRMPALADAVPSYVECVTVFAHDDIGAGYARELAAALLRRKLEVRIEGLAT